MKSIIESFGQDRARWIIDVCEPLTISLTLQYHIAILLRLYTMICHMTPAGSLELYGCQCFYRTTIIPLTGFDNRSLYVCACTSFGRGKEGHSDCDCTCQYTHVRWSRVNTKQVYCSLGGPEHPQTISIMGTNSGSGNASSRLFIMLEIAF